MSSHVVINTMKFCTCDTSILETALKALTIQYGICNGTIVVNQHKIESLGNNLFMRIDSEDRATTNLFSKINSKVAELEIELNELKRQQYCIEMETARQDSKAYQVRHIKKEQDDLARQNEKLKLEREDFVDAKKQAVILKAKSMGYSVQESVENGTIKLKLIKRVY